MFNISLEYKDNLNSSFPICIHLISSSFLIAFVSALSTMLKMSNDGWTSGQSCLIIDFNGIALGFYSSRCCWLWGCHIQPLLCWALFPIAQLYWGLLSWRYGGYSVKSFFCIYWADREFLSISPLHDLSNFLTCTLNHPQISEIKLTWLWYMIFFCVPVCILQVWNLISDT